MRAQQDLASSTPHSDRLRFPLLPAEPRTLLKRLLTLRWKASLSHGAASLSQGGRPAEHRTERTTPLDSSTPGGRREADSVYTRDVRGWEG